MEMELWGFENKSVLLKAFRFSFLQQANNPNNGALRNINNRDGYYLDQSGIATITATQVDRPDHIEDFTTSNGSINYGLEPCITQEGHPESLAADEYHNICQVTVRQDGPSLRWFCLPEDEATSQGRRRPTDQEYNLIRRATNNFTFRVSQGDSSATIPHNVCHLGSSVHIYERNSILQLTCSESGQGSTFFGGPRNFSDLPPTQVAQFARQIPADSRASVMCLSRGERETGYRRAMFFGTQNSADSLAPLLTWLDRPGGFSATGARSYSVPYFNGANFFDGFVDDSTAAAYYDGLYSFLSPQYSVRNSSINMGVSIGASAILGVAATVYGINRSVKAQKQSGAELFDLNKVVTYRGDGYRTRFAERPETSDQALARTSAQAQSIALFQRAMNNPSYPHVYLSAASGGGKGWVMDTIGYLVTNHLIDSVRLEDTDVDFWSVDASRVNTEAAAWANGSQTIFGRIIRQAQETVSAFSGARGRLFGGHLTDNIRVSVRNLQRGHSPVGRKLIFIHLEEAHQFLEVGGGTGGAQNILTQLLTVMNRSIPEDAQIVFILDSSQMTRIFEHRGTRDLPRRGQLIELPPPTIDQVRQAVSQYVESRRLRSDDPFLQRAFQNVEFTPEAMEAIALLGHEYGRQRATSPTSPYRDPPEQDPNQENIGAPPSSNNKLIDQIISEALNIRRQDLTQPQTRTQRAIQALRNLVTRRSQHRIPPVTRETVLRVLARDATNRGETTTQQDLFHRLEDFRNHPDNAQRAIVDAYYRGFTPIRGRIEDPRNLPRIDTSTVFDSPLSNLTVDMEARVREMETLRISEETDIFKISNEAIEVAVELSNGNPQEAVSIFRNAIEAAKRNTPSGTSFNMTGTSVRLHYAVTHPQSTTNPVSPTHGPNTAPVATTPTDAPEWRHALTQPFGEREMNAATHALQQLGRPGQEAARAFVGAVHSYQQSYPGAQLTFETVSGLFPGPARNAARVLMSAGLNTSNYTERAVYELAIAIAKANGVTHTFTDEDRSDFLDAYRAHTNAPSGARTTTTATQSLPWREVWSTELGDNEAIIRAFDNTEPELAQLWRTEIASGGQTFNTLGELIVRLESINPEYVTRAYRALTDGTSTLALTDHPHRALYALLDQTREVMAETSAGGRRAAVRQTRTLQDREDLFKTSLEQAERVSLRSREMSPDVERERRERIEAEARNAHAPSTVRVRH